MRKISSEDDFVEYLVNEIIEDTFVSYTKVDLDENTNKKLANYFQVLKTLNSEQVIDIKLGMKHMLYSSFYTFLSVLENKAEGYLGGKFKLTFEDRKTKKAIELNSEQADTLAGLLIEYSNIDDFY